MDRHQFDADAYETQLRRKIDSRTEEIENEIRASKAETIDAVLMHSEGFEGSYDEAVALLKAAVTGRAALVGIRIDSLVNNAISVEAAIRAEQDVADMERRRKESADEDKIERRQWHKEMA